MVNSVISFIQAIAQCIAALAWPFVALVFLLMFKSDIRGLLARLLKGELLGQKVEFESVARQLDDANRTELPALPHIAAPPEANAASTNGESAGEAPDEHGPSVESTINAILHVLSVSPQAALVTAEVELNRAASRLANALAGKPSSDEILPLDQALSRIAEFDGVSRKIRELMPDETHIPVTLGSDIVKKVEQYVYLGQLTAGMYNDPARDSLAAKYVSGVIELLRDLDMYERYLPRLARKLADT